MALGSAWNSIKTSASGLVEKVKDSKVVDGITDFFDSTKERIKGMIDYFKGAEDTQAGAEDVYEDDQSARTYDTLSTVGLQFAEATSEDQAILNIAQMNFMQASIAGSKDGISFDADTVNQQISDFVDYYVECSELDPDSADFDAKLAELDNKYGKDITSALDKASDMYLDYIDGLNAAADKDTFMRANADVAYACSDIDMNTYADILRSQGKRQVGVTTEDYMNGGVVQDYEDTESEDIAYTNFNIDLVDLGDGAGALYARYATLKFARDIAKEGLVNPVELNNKMQEFSDFLNEYSSVVGDTEDEVRTKIDELRARSSPEMVEMFDRCEADITKLSKEADDYRNGSLSHIPSTPDVEKAMNNWYKNHCSDPDTAYAMGYMSFADYVERNGDKVFWLCNDEAEYNTTLTELRNAAVDDTYDVASEAEMEIDT